MSTTSTGRQAEAAAVDYLKGLGYIVRDQNWRTRFCEIDVVATKGGEVYFVEVKYRHHTAQGGGLAYITPAKLRQMRFAAESWVADTAWSGDYSLSAIEVTGDDFEITAFIENLM